MDRVEKAVELFRGGCACSQAVLAVYGPAYGLGEADALRIAAGFAGGMRLAETCGAVTGAFMVLGLAHCDEACRTAAGRQAAYSAVVSLAERFRQQHGSLLCRDLLGCDISTPEGAQVAREKGLFASTCVDAVRSAARTLEELLPAR